MKERSAVLKHGLLLFLLAAALLTVPVLADMGPKPQLTVRVENGPEELYYLDLLEEGEPYPYPDQVPGGLKGNYGEELETLDQDLLAAFTAAVPEGWHACVAQGDLVWGRIDSRDGCFTFGYMLPSTFRILLATKSGETFLSEPMERQALQCSLTVDWATKTVKSPPLWKGYIVQFLATFLPTLAIEGLLLLLFRLWSKRNALVFLGVNLLTQGGLTLWMSVGVVHGGANGISMLSSDYFSLFTRIQSWLDSLCYEAEGISPRLLPAELVILLAEAALYRKLFRDCSKRKAALYALTANLASFLLGLYLAEPVWRAVVDTML